MKSVLQTNKECFMCETTFNLEEHHCIYGRFNRKKSEARGFKVWLCSEHHRGKEGVHNHSALDMYLKQLSQTYYENHYGTREQFIKEFSRSWL